MDEATKAKIRGMSQGDIPIAQRRALYNGMNRRFRSGGLKPGLLQKYNACINEKKNRFKMLKEFIIDEDMFIPQFTSPSVMILGSTCSTQVNLKSLPRAEVEVEAYFVQPKSQ